MSTTPDLTQAFREIGLALDARGLKGSYSLQVALWRHRGFVARLNDDDTASAEWSYTISVHREEPGGGLLALVHAAPSVSTALGRLLVALDSGKVEA